MSDRRRYLNVTLTGTRNPYIPAGTRGELGLLETGAHGRLVSPSFRPLLPDGRLGDQVDAPDPVFTYTPAVDRLIARWRRLAEAAQADGWEVNADGELACPECSEALALIATGRVGHCGDICGETQPFADDRPDLGSTDALELALVCAVADAGAGGATIDDVMEWLGDNHSGGPLPQQTVLARLAALTGAERMASYTYHGPLTRWHVAPGDQPAAQLARAFPAT